MRYAACENKYNISALSVGFLIAGLFGAGSIPSTVFAASAQITEIMYDVSGTDTGREWVEIQNTGTSTIDLSTWKLFEANTNHKIAAAGAAGVPAGGFAVIADVPDKFRADNPSYQGLLFDSAFSLSNDGESISIRDENGVDLDSVSYLPAWGAAGDGYSLQRSVVGTWISAAPTPGSVTVATVSSAPPSSAAEETASSSASVSVDSSSSSTATVSDSASSDAISAYSSQEIANTSSDKPTLEMTSGRARLGFVDSPLSFEAKIKSAANIPVGLMDASNVENIWSFGDGTMLSGKYVEHAYLYPGDYIVILNSRYSGSEAVSKVSVKIVDPRLSVSVQDGEYIELSNHNPFETNVGGYAISSGKDRFIVPKDTIISPNASLKISSRNMKAHLCDDGNAVTVSDPLGKVVGGSTCRAVMVSIPTDIDADTIRARYESFGKITL